MKTKKLLLPLLLFGCSLTMLTAHATEMNQHNHTLTLAIGEEPTKGFDPMLGWSHGSYLLLHSPLLQQSADLGYHNFLTTDVHHSVDGKTWFITLKPNLKFSDGTPLTATDVVFTYNYAAKAGAKVDMGNFIHAKSTSPLTVEIQLSAPQSTFLMVLSSLGIVSKSEYNPQLYTRHPVGAGPYRLVSYQPGQQLIVERNPYYAGKTNDFNKLVFAFMDEESAYAGASNHEIDIIRIPPASAIRKTEDLRLWVRPSVENRALTLPVVPKGKVNDKGEPIGNDVTADIAIRQAINYAINRNVLANDLMEGHAIPAYSDSEGLPWANPDAHFKDGDLAKANKILDKAGWKIANDGIRYKKGLAAKITIYYPATDSTRKDLSEAIKEMLKPIGIDVSLKSSSWDSVERNMYSNPALLGGGSLDPGEITHYYSSKNAGVEFFNPGYYSNKTVDKHIQDALNASNEKAAIPFWQKVYWDGKQGVGDKGDVPWVWLVNVQHVYLTNPCVDLGHGAPEFHGSWSLLTNLQDWKWTCH